MAKKIIVQMPSYSYVEVTPALLQLLINAPVYEYDWESKNYFKSDSNNLEVRTTDDDHIFGGMTKDSWKEIQKQEGETE